MTKHTITKVQMSYIENRLKDIKHEKVNKFKEKLPKTELNFKDYVNLIYDGVVKMKSRKEALMVDRYYSPDIRDLYDFEPILREKSKVEDKIRSYECALNDAITKIMDKVVLSDLGINDAIEQFKKLEPKM